MIYKLFTHIWEFMNFWANKTREKKERKKKQKILFTFTEKRHCGGEWKQRKKKVYGHGRESECWAEASGYNIIGWDGSARLRIWAKFIVFREETENCYWCSGALNSRWLIFDVGWGYKLLSNRYLTSYLTMGRVQRKGCWFLAFFAIFFLLKWLL